MHRPELLTLLRTRQVLGMPLSGFATAGLRLVVYSELLGERVIFASDNARLPPADSERVVYRAEELRELLGLAPEELRRVHLVKRVFRGAVSLGRSIPGERLSETREPSTHRSAFGAARARPGTTPRPRRRNEQPH